MNTTTYFYRDKEGHEIGPFDLPTLSKFRLAGVLDGDTPIRTNESAEWNACRTIIADPPSLQPPTSQPQLVAGTPTLRFDRRVAAALVGIVAIGAISYGVSVLRSRMALGDTDKCRANLRNMDKAVQMWALDKKKGPKDGYELTDKEIVSWMPPIDRNDPSKRFPVCPSGGQYRSGPSVGKFPLCSHPGHYLEEIWPVPTDTTGSEWTSPKWQAARDEITAIFIKHNDKGDDVREKYLTKQSAYLMAIRSGQLSNYEAILYAQRYDQKAHNIISEFGGARTTSLCRSLQNSPNIGFNPVMF